MNILVLAADGAKGVLKSREVVSCLSDLGLDWLGHGLGIRNHFLNKVKSSFNFLAVNKLQNCLLITEIVIVGCARIKHR